MPAGFRHVDIFALNCNRPLAFSSPVPGREICCANSYLYWAFIFICTPLTLNLLEIFLHVVVKIKPSHVDLETKDELEKGTGGGVGWHFSGLVVPLAALKCPGQWVTQGSLKPGEVGSGQPRPLADEGLWGSICFQVQISHHSGGVDQMYKTWWLSSVLPRRPNE